MADVDFMWVAENASKGVVTSLGGLGKNFTCVQGISMTKGAAQSRKHGYDLRCGYITARVQGEKASSDNAFPTLEDVLNALEMYDDFKIRCGGPSPKICISWSKQEKQQTMLGSLLGSLTRLVGSAGGYGKASPLEPTTAPLSIVKDQIRKVNMGGTVASLLVKFLDDAQVPVSFSISSRESEGTTKAVIPLPTATFSQVIKALAGQQFEKPAMDKQEALEMIVDLIEKANDA